MDSKILRREWLIAMKVGKLDLDTDPRYKYLLVYKDKRDDTINTWTLDESALKVNYKQMKLSGDVEFLGIYRKLDDSELLDTMIK
jgi:hypothetical protein